MNNTKEKLLSPKEVDCCEQYYHESSRVWSVIKKKNKEIVKIVKDNKKTVA